MNWHADHLGNVWFKKNLKEERVQEEREPKIKRGKDLGKRELERETDDLTKGMYGSRRT